MKNSEIINVWLKDINLEDGDNYLQVLNELSSYEDAFAKPMPETISKEDFESFKKTRIMMREGLILSKKVVPTNTYWIMDGDIPIGYATLKHVADTSKPGGHFGCCLLKKYQNKGIGSIVADMLSQIAYEALNITQIIYTAKNENIQSQKNLEKIGAKLLSIHDGYHFYEVNLEELYKERGRK